MFRVNNNKVTTFILYFFDQQTFIILDYLELKINKNE